VRDEGERERDRGLAAVGQLGLALEIERRVGFEAALGKRPLVSARVVAGEDEHRQALVLLEKARIEGPEAEMAGRRGYQAFGRRDGDQLDKTAVEQGEVVSRAEGLACVRRQGETEALVSASRRFTVLRAKHQMVDPASHLAPFMEGGCGN